MEILFVCTIGDPSSPATWSATPYNVINSLKRQGIKPITCYPRLNKVESFFLKVLTVVLMQPRNSYNKLYRNYWYFKVRQFKKRQNLKSKIIFHFGQSSLPTYKDRNAINLVYIDNTQAMWQQKTQDYTVSDAEQRALANATYIFSISNYVRRHLLVKYQIHPSSVSVVGCGSGNIEPYFGAKKNRKLLLFVAKERFAEKGGHYVIKALDKLNAGKSRSEMFRLIVVGQKLSTEIPVEFFKRPDVYYYGFISSKRLQVFFNIANLFVMPANNEPWGLVYIQAMLTKTYPVGANKNAFPEIVDYGKYGGIVDLERIDTLSDAILRAHNDINDDLLYRMQQYALKKYNWDRVAAEIVSKVRDGQLA